MRTIDFHAHLGDIYGAPGAQINLEDRSLHTVHPQKANFYEALNYGNIYFGKLNYLFKPLIISAARVSSKYGNLPNLFESMASNRIDKAVILALEPFVPSDSILEAGRKHKNLIPFCSVHPHDQNKKEKIGRYVKAGAKGLKLHPVVQNFNPDDPAVFELLEEIKPHHLPVLFHTGWGAIGHGSYGFIGHYKKLLDNFKDIIFIFAHIGFYEPAPFIELMSKHDNVFGDISWQPAGIIKKAIDKLGAERLVYGSDWPFNRQGTSLKLIEKVTAGNKNLMEKLLFKNAEKLLKLTA